MWWIGMHHPGLQILIHGEHIADYSPNLKYSGVSIERVQRTENPNYLFVYLDISSTAAAGTLEIQLKSLSDKSLPIRTLQYPLLQREPNSAERAGFGPEDVMYLITPDRFANGNTSNDAVPGMKELPNRTNPYGRHGGDLEGIIQHLDYIQEMGFTAIWLNPVVENNMEGQSYHGYAATDFYRIDARFGSNEDYVRLSREAGKRGIKLVMDQIMNHCGSSHWWMADLPAPDWIHSVDHFVPTTHRRVVLNDPYVAPSDIKKFTDGWFVRSMPDLNQDHPLLADYMIQNSIWWVEFANLGGIRHDTHPYAGKSFMADYSCRIMEEYPNFTIVGEEWSLNPAIIAKWQRGKVNPDGYVSCMPSMFDFPLQAALIQSLTQPESWNTGWIQVYEMLSNDFLYADPFRLVTFPDNHDMDRIYTSLGEDYDLFKMALVYFLTMRGIPQIYYGTELLLTNAQPGNHGLIRADFPGGWPADSIDGFKEIGLRPDQKNAQDFIRKLLNWRKESKVIQKGRLMQYAPSGDLYVYFRYLEHELVLVAFNKGDTRIELHPADYPEMLDGITEGWNVMDAQAADISSIFIEPRSSLIIQCQK